MPLRLFRDIPRSVLRAEAVARKEGQPLFKLGGADFRTAKVRSALRHGFEFFGQHGPSDDRHEPYVYGDPQQQHCANAVAAIVPCDALEDCGDYWTLANRKPCAEKESLCWDEPFSRQPRFHCNLIQPLAWSGALVHERALLTCWHGHKDLKDKQHYAVFGFASDPNGTFELRFSRRDVVPIEGVICGNGPPDSTTEDWAILSLKCAVKHRDSLEVAEMPDAWWQSAAPAVYTLGHPIDLPMKLTDNAWATAHPTMSERFVAPLDTYLGCSGSPVFAVAANGRHVIMGIVVKGQSRQTDHKKDERRGCWYRRVYRCSYSELCGQGCVRAWVFAPCVEALHGKGEVRAVP